MNKERTYKTSVPNCGGIPSEEEANFFAEKLETTPENILVIYEGNDEDGNWFDEIWDERDVGFPQRENDSKETMMSDYFFTYWEINVPEIGKGILVQDASPIGIAFKKDELLKSKFKIIIEEFYE